MLNNSFLTDFGYYFSAQPSIGSYRYMIPMLIFFGIMFVVATYFKIVFEVYRRHLPHYLVLGQKLSSWLYTISILGLIYVFFRYEGIMYLSSRILMILLIVCWATWGILILKFYRSEFVEIKERQKAKQEKKVYLPKRRKK